MAATTPLKVSFMWHQDSYSMSLKGAESSMHGLDLHFQHIPQMFYRIENWAMRHLEHFFSFFYQFQKCLFMKEATTIKENL